VAAADLGTRRDQLVELWRELSDCQKCPLAEGRTTVVFGTGNADADLMFVGEAPGFHEDRQGKPFVGRAGQLLDQLLESIGMDRSQCFIANVLKCRPPDNRDPEPGEIQACQGHLFRQIELIQPRVICTLGNFATKLLSGSPQGITKVRGVPQAKELGGHSVFLYPIFHPAAALRTPAMLETLRQDFGKLPGMLEESAPSLPPASAVEPGAPGGGEYTLSRPDRAPATEEPAERELVGAGVAVGAAEPGEPGPDQLGLF
jgi:uracil-DNA glycosylase family 4